MFTKFYFYHVYIFTEFLKIIFIYLQRVLFSIISICLHCFRFFHYLALCLQSDFFHHLCMFTLCFCNSYMFTSLVFFHHLYVYRVKMSSPNDFFSLVEKESTGNLCTWHGELYLEMHNGTYTTQAKVRGAAASENHTEHVV